MAGPPDREESKQPESQGFSAGEAARLSGVKYATLAYWDRSGFLSPSIARARGAGKGRGRIYSFRDVVALRTAQALRDQGISLQRIRVVVRFLQGEGLSGHGLEAPLSEAKLIVPPEGDDVLVVRDSHTLWSALARPGQGVMRLVVEVGTVEGELREHIAERERAARTGSAREASA